MKMVFFDTWGWAAIAHRNDTHHDKVASFYSSFLLNKGIPVTTDYVLAETITLLRSKTNPEAVTLFIDTILNASFVVMKECNIKDALTADRHFEEIGLGFKKLF